MRARSADNFRPDDLIKIIAECRRHGANAYLALNTILFDEELEEARSLCLLAKNAGVDAVIAADPAILEAAKSAGLAIHISVQANVTNLVAVKFFSSYADVIVLARELSLDQIRGIIQGIREQHIIGPSGNLVQIEIFAHGALCVAFSGKCQMSLSIYGPKAAASRGACFQPCRRTYRVTDQETGEELTLDGHQVMSPKDLCTLPFLDQILDAGVSVLKIEGRGRAADFVSAVVSVYREGINAWQNGTFQEKQKTGRWMTELEKVFNRGFWVGGYYLGKPIDQWASCSDSQATERKVFAGEITNYYSRIGIAEGLIHAQSIQLGDDLWILGKTTGAIRTKVAELRVGKVGASVTKADKGSVVAFPVPVKVRSGDKLYRIDSTAEPLG